MQAPKISVIGGSGFIGTNLCQILSDEGFDFEIIDLRLSETFPGKTKIVDITDLFELTDAIEGEIIIHLAAVHRDDIRNVNEYFQTNVLGTENVVAVCEKKKISKIIFTSTVAVYGFVDTPTSESGEINPFNHYGETKAKAEIILNGWQKKTGGSLIILRPTVVFGLGNRGNVYKLFEQIWRKKFIMIGDGKNKKSLAYVKNLAAFIKRCLKDDMHLGVYNYVDYPNLDMNTFIKLTIKTLFFDKGFIRIPKVLGMFIGRVFDIIGWVTFKKFSISYIRVKKFTSSTEFVTTEISEDMFVPPYKLEDGIKETLTGEFLQPQKNRQIFYTE